MRLSAVLVPSANWAVHDHQGLQANHITQLILTRSAKTSFCSGKFIFPSLICVIVFIISQRGRELLTTFSVFYLVLHDSSVESVRVLVKAVTAAVGCSEPMMTYKIGVGVMLMCNNLWTTFWNSRTCFENLCLSIIIWWFSLLKHSS